MMSAQRANGTRRRRAYHQAASVAGDDPAVDTQPRIRRQDDLDRVVRVQLPLVDDVVQPAADERGHGDDDDPVADHIGILAGQPREPDEQHVRDGEPDRVAQPVPADAERAELERDGIRGDVEHTRECMAAAARAVVRPYTSRR